ncbi:hypothetical protein [Micromonospora chersina]
MDLVGKSTLARAVAHDPCQIHESPPQAFRSAAKVVANAPYEASLALYLAANIAASDQLEEVPTHESKYLVRHYWSTLCYYSANSGVPIAEVELLAQPFTARCLQPSAFVLVRASREARLRRLAERVGSATASDELSLSPTFERKLEAAFRHMTLKSRSPVIDVDTTKASLEESSEWLRSRLEQL